jgi:hypothetical protein
MKKLLTIISVVALSAGSVFAACGKKVTDEGKLTSYSAEKKEVTITTAEGKAVNRVLTPDSKVSGKIEELVGKSVKVVSEHNKIDSVTGA